MVMLYSKNTLSLESLLHAFKGLGAGSWGWLSLVPRHFEEGEEKVLV